MADNWPATLPDFVLVDGYAEAVADGRLVSRTDAGPAKIRRRTSAQPRPLIAQIFVDDDQLDDLRDFVDGTLIGGSLPFNFTDPVDGSTVLVRFAERLPSWTSIVPGHWKVMLELEVLP